MKKEKKIVRVDETDTKENVTVDSDRKIVKTKHVEEIPKEGAKPRRIFAVILWVLAIACEVVGILNIFNKLELPKLNQLTWLIILIVADLIFLVIGSMLWKKANHIDPASEKNKTKFWLWNNLGSIVAVLAFLPLIIIIFTNKDLDGRTKKIAGIIAIVALLIGGVASYDFNPVSQEALDKANAEILANGGYEKDENGNDVVYWVKNSKKYHIKHDCPAINNSNNVEDYIRSGSLKAAFQKGLTEPCRRCIKAIEKEQTENSTEKAGE